MNRNWNAARPLGRTLIGATMLIGSLSSGCYTGISAKQVTLAGGGSTTEVDKAGKKTGRFLDNSQTEGLRYFLPAPVLVVEQIDKGKYDARVEFTVDHSRVFAVQPTETLASSTATIEFYPDGTLKNFQLNQDSTEVPAAVVKGLQDLETKKLDLQKAAIDKAAEASAARIEKGPLPAAPEGARKVCVYRIDGPKLTPAPDLDGNCNALKVLPEEPAGQGEGLAAKASKLSATLSPDRSTVVIAFAGRELGTNDANDIVFMKGKIALQKEADQAALRGALLTGAGGTLVIRSQLLRDHGVTRLRFGKDYASVPKS